MEIVIEAIEYKEFLESIHFVYGYDFTDYVESSVKRRIVHFMENRKIDTLDTLREIVLKDEDIFEEFVQGISITLTEMFRDPLFYKSVREKVMKRLATYPVIKIWIAGCATGEEVYSIAIVLREEGLLDRTIIYATDINQKSLQIARQGIYSLTDMKKYTENYLNSGGSESFSIYYTAKYNSVLFEESLKRNIVFASHNLSADKSFNEFQLVVCRNVLMYFKSNLQSKVISLFCDSLCDFGFLALGDKESLLFSDKNECFEEMSKKEKIYMKIRT